jgi:hypothetical protein
MFSVALHNAVVDWGSFYANHAAVRTTVVFCHLGGLIAAAGAAVTADRGLLRSYGLADTARQAQLTAVRGTHRMVLIGLTLVILSGALLFASDVDTFYSSGVFWTKMGLVALLIINGAALTSAERRAADGQDAAWRTLRVTASASMALWFLITLFGVTLTNT